MAKVNFNIAAAALACTFIAGSASHKCHGIPIQPQEAAQTLQTPLAVVLGALSEHEGAFLGDLHGHLNIAEWMAANMQNFADGGVAQLFFEMVHYADQYLIDDFYAGTENADIKLRGYLEAYWGDKSPGAGSAYFAMIGAARDAGIRVYGMDLFVDDFSERLEISNPHWADVVKRKRIVQGSTPEDKYFIFGGKGHSANYRQNKGVDAMLGDIPSFDFFLPSLLSGEGPVVVTEPYITKSDGQDCDYVIYLPDSPNQRREGQDCALVYSFNAPDWLVFAPRGGSLIESESGHVPLYTDLHQSGKSNPLFDDEPSP